MTAALAFFSMVCSAIAALFATAPTQTVPSLPVGCILSISPTFTFHTPATPNGKRVYLYHGLNSPTFYDSGIGKTLVDTLTAAGVEVITPILPDGQACFFTNGGWQYRDRFVTALNSIKASVEAAHGMAQKNIAGGISYGGLHAMMATASTGSFIAWFAHVPVTRIDALSEFTTVGDVNKFNPFFQVSALKDTTGLIAWGTADTRVNFQLTKTLSQSFGPGVTKTEYVGQDHSTNAQNVADIAAWVAAR